MGRLRDNAWQFTITLIVSLVSLLFTVLTFQSNSLRIVGVAVVFILIFGIVLINLIPTSKTAGQQQSTASTPISPGGTPPYNYYQGTVNSSPYGNASTPPPPPPPGISPQYPYAYQYPYTPTSTPPVTSSGRQPRLTPAKQRLLILSLIGWVLYIIGVALVGNSAAGTANSITTTFLVIGDLVLIVVWIISLVNIARLGYWGWFTLTLLTFWFGIFFYIFFSPNIPRKALPQPSMR